MQFVGASYVAASSGTTPTHAVGDLLVVVAVRWSAATAPTLPAGWTSAYSSNTTYGRRVGWKIATSTNDATGTWTNAGALYVAVWRDAAIGAVASNASASNAAVPALTLATPARVGGVVIPNGVQAGIPVGAASRWTDGYTRWWDTDADVTSWAAQTLSSILVAVSIELDSTSTPLSATDAGTLTAAETSALAAVVDRADTGTLSATEARTLAAASTLADAGTLTGVESATLTAVTSPRADAGVLAAAERSAVRKAASRADLAQPWDSPARGSWATITRTPDWEAVVGERVRTITGWGELVDAQGRPVQIMTDTGRPRWRLPLSAATVSYDAEQALSWSARMSFAHPWLIPTWARHPLWGASGLRIRLWWSIWSRRAGDWWSMPLCTLAIGDTAAADTGTISGTIAGRDVLATMIGYGGGAPVVAGQTIDRAIATILAQSAPTLEARIAPTTVIVPDGTSLRDPRSDIESLVEAGYPAGVIRSDREGGVYVGPRPTSTDTPLSWQEGPGCPVVAIDWAHGVTAMGNRVTAVSTHPDAVGLLATASDDDPTSPTYVGGPWGVRPLPVASSSVAATAVALQAVADAALDRGLHPREEIRLKVAPRPDLYGWRTARVARGSLGVATVAQVSSWSLALPVAGVDPGLMDVGLMQREA